MINGKFINKSKNMSLDIIIETISKTFEDFKSVNLIRAPCPTELYFYLLTCISMAVIMKREK